MASTECSTCHQEIWWVEKFPLEINPDTGQPRRIAVNADSITAEGDPKGKIEVWSERIATDGGQPLWALYGRYLNKQHPVPGPGHKMGVSHFATCEQAGQWRRSPASSRRS
jgi:hypothetical protein